MPIHGDTQIDLKTEKGYVVNGHSKKMTEKENQKKKRQRQKAKILGKCLAGVIASAHSLTVCIFMFLSKPFPPVL